MSTEYPKIETLFDRDKKTFNVIEGNFRLPEFANVKKWFLTEKVDGTNVRVLYEKGSSGVEFYGRTNNAQMPTFLLKYLQQTFTAEKLNNAFSKLSQFELVVLYGEGYGVKIQKGGNYRKEGVSFRLFDVRIGKWWLELDSIKDIADKLGIRTVPYLGEFTTDEAIAYLKTKPLSHVSNEDNGIHTYVMEGIVARPQPLLLRRNGKRLIWKLKCRDYRRGKK